MIRSPQPRPATEPRAVGHNRRTCAFCRSMEEADREYGTPCLICGAPINSEGEGHDPGCMGLSD